MRKRYGIKLTPESGPCLEISAGVISETPGFAEMIGQVAASWAILEAGINTALALLMDTSPDRTFALMSAYRNADAAMKAAQKLSKAALDPQSHDKFMAILKRIDQVREERNNVQHGLWTKKGEDNHTLYLVKPLDFTKFYMNMLPLLTPPFSRATVANELLSRGIELSDSTFASYTVQDLSLLIRRIDNIGADIGSFSQGLMAHRIGHVSSAPTDHIDPVD